MNFNIYYVIIYYNSFFISQTTGVWLSFLLPEWNTSEDVVLHYLF